MGSPVPTGDPPLCAPGPTPIGRLAALSRQPSACRDDQGLDAGLQGRMDNGRKAWTMVGRDLGEPARLLGFRIMLGVGAADEPEH